jgi:hypothetical protein
MSDDTRAGRMSVRFTDDDRAWLAEHAEDEGVEPATLVRLIINRLRRGRPLLMSLVAMPVAAAPQPAYRRPARVVAAVAPASEEPGEAEPLDGAVVEDVLNSRLAELEGGDVVPLHTEQEAAAIPLRRMPRENYNPGRR